MPGVFTLDSTTLPEPKALTNGRPDLTGNDGVLISNTPIPDLNVRNNGPISLQVPSDAFSYGGNTSNLQLNATLADGRPLPAWLKFDPSTGRFTGTPPMGFEGTLSFKVSARDSQGHVAVQTFKIVVTREGQNNQRAQLERGQQEPAGRPGLNEQIRSAHTVGADRLAMLSRSPAMARLRI